MSRERRQYDKEYKLEAVRLISEGGRKVVEVARDLMQAFWQGPPLKSKPSSPAERPKPVPSIRAAVLPASNASGSDCDQALQLCKQGFANDMPINPKRIFLNKRELSEYLGLSVFTIDSWVSEKREIPFIKMGKKVMFDINDIQKWIEKKKIFPKSPTDY